MTEEPPRVVASERAYSGWNTLDIVTVEATDADGVRRRHQREMIDHGSAAVLLVIDRKRETALLVRQWRAGLILAGGDPYLLEACAGLIDPGETPPETARREAAEELGVMVEGLRSLGSVVPSAGTLTERMYLFVADLAQDAQRTPGGGIPHEGESIEVVEVPLAELFAMASAGTIEDAKTLIIVQRLMLERGASP